MAPQQLERLAYSKASDVFAFGVLLYEIWARSAPWPGVADVNVIAKVIAGAARERADARRRDRGAVLAAGARYAPKHALRVSSAQVNTWR